MIILGGAIGASMRHAIGLVAARADTAIPLGTLCVNTVGSALAGALVAWLALRSGDTLWRPFVQVGILGSLTTYSAFSVDTLRLFQSGYSGLALCNVLLNVGLSLAAVFAGYLGLRAALL